MSLAMERKEQKDKVSGAIILMRSMNASDQDIIAKIPEVFKVTQEYVLTLIKEQGSSLPPSPESHLAT